MPAAASAMSISAISVTTSTKTSLATSPVAVPNSTMRSPHLSMGSAIHCRTCSARSSPRMVRNGSLAVCRAEMVSSPSTRSLRYSTLDSRAPSIAATAPIRLGRPISSRTPRFDNPTSSGS